MNRLILLAQAETGGTVEQIARTFGVDWVHLLAQVISFAIVCVLLHRFAYKRVLAVLEERRQKITEGLANADRIKEELARTEAQRQQILAKANGQANQLIEQARAAAARVQQQETQKAIATAEQIVTRAREAATREHERMLGLLRHEVGHLVVQTAGTVTGKILTSEDQRRLAEETTKAVGV